MNQLNDIFYLLRNILRQAWCQHTIHLVFMYKVTLKMINFKFIGTSIHTLICIYDLVVATTDVSICVHGRRVTFRKHLMAAGGNILSVMPYHTRLGGSFMCATTRWWMIWGAMPSFLPPSFTQTSNNSMMRPTEGGGTEWEGTSDVREPTIGIGSRNWGTGAGDCQ